jgi:hypothetical protein
MFGHGAKPLVKEENLETERLVRRSRAVERQANWELQKRTAEEALERRAERNKGSLFERVEKAKERLTPLPAGAALALYEAANSIDRDIMFLAEEAGKGRKEILRMWTEPRKSLREQLVQEASERLSPAPTSEPEAAMQSKPAPKSRAKRPAKE